MLTKLSSSEINIYFILWFLANVYSLYKIYEVQTELLKGEKNIEYRFKDLKPGWSILSRRRDVSDFEWSSLKLLLSSSWYYLLLHFVISELLRKDKTHLLQYWHIIASIFYITRVFGLKQVFALLIQPVIFSTVTFRGGGKIAVWITCILILISLNSLKNKHSFWEFFDHEDMRDEEIYLLLVSLGWMELRCLSFCLSYIELKEIERRNSDFPTKEKLFTKIIDMLSYVLYLPTLYVGPIILYEDFQESFVKQEVDFVQRLKIFVKNMSVYLLYMVLLELALHYIYFLAMQDDLQILRKMPSMALCGGGLWLGLQFHMKYVISYGIVGAFVKLDHIKPPPTPRCIARIHVYSQMWRYFDVGLYKFLVKYIYKPVIGLMSAYRKNKPCSTFKLAASFVTFVFIFIWHGTTLSILIWSLLNYIGITLEQLSSQFVETDKYKYFKSNILKSDRMEARFKALLSAPLFAMSAISSFFLFSGYEMGSLFLEYATHPSLWNSLIIFTALYAGCHVSTALQDVPSRTAKCMKLSNT